MNTKKTVFSKIAKGMPKKQVKLSIVQNLITEFGALEDAYSDANYLAYEYGDQLLDKIESYRQEIGEIDNFVVNSMVTQLKGIAEDVNAMLEELEQKANDLGIEPADIFDQYNEAKEYVNFADASYRDAEAKYKEIVEYSGFLADFWK